MRTPEQQKPLEEDCYQILNRHIYDEGDFAGMPIISVVVVDLVALLHACFLILEMFFWDKPTGLKVFGHTKEQAGATKALATNQGRR